MTNRLYYGDNLDWLSNPRAFPDGCVDLVYLDPPFNSNATYSQLFRSPDGKTADSQIDAFEDTWSWGVSAEAAYVRKTKPVFGNFWKARARSSFMKVAI